MFLCYVVHALRGVSDTSNIRRRTTTRSDKQSRRRQTSDNENETKKQKDTTTDNKWRTHNTPDATHTSHRQHTDTRKTPHPHHNHNHTETNLSTTTYAFGFSQYVSLFSCASCSFTVLAASRWWENTEMCVVEVAVTIEVESGWACQEFLSRSHQPLCYLGGPLLNKKPQLFFFLPPTLSPSKAPFSILPH